MKQVELRTFGLPYIVHNCFDHQTRQENSPLNFDLINFKTSRYLHHNLLKPLTEDQIFEALVVIQNGTSIRQAPKDWAIHNTTLRNRISGQPRHRTAHQSSQRLSIDQEDHLASWVLPQASLQLIKSYGSLRKESYGLKGTQYN